MIHNPRKNLLVILKNPKREGGLPNPNFHIFLFILNDSVPKYQQDLFSDSKTKYSRSYIEKATSMRAVALAATSVGARTQLATPAGEAPALKSHSTAASSKGF